MTRIDDTPTRRSARGRRGVNAAIRTRTYLAAFL
jgi:hypothetical protein